MAYRLYALLRGPIGTMGGTTLPRRTSRSGVSRLLTLTRIWWWDRLCSGNLIPAHAYTRKALLFRYSFYQLIDEL